MVDLDEGVVEEAIDGEVVDDSTNALSRNADAAELSDLDNLNTEEEVVEVGDLSDQQGGVIDPAPRVGFVIRKAEIRTQKDEESGSWRVKKLAVQNAVGPLGVDGEGKYAGKIFFTELVLTMNTAEFPDDYKSDWWKKEARFDTKQFLQALGEDIGSVRITRDFVESLKDREIVADIQRKERRRKGDDGKYHGTGEFENLLKNFRKPAGSESSGDSE